MVGAEFVSGLVALDAQGMEQVADVAIELDLAAQPVQQVGLGARGLQLDAGPRGRVLSQNFAELAQLDQRGMGSLAKTRSAL